jgi:hypothetical protein
VRKSGTEALLNNITVEYVKQMFGTEALLNNITVEYVKQMSEQM